MLKLKALGDKLHYIFGNHISIIIIIFIFFVLLKIYEYTHLSRISNNSSTLATNFAVSNNLKVEEFREQYKNDIEKRIMRTQNKQNQYYIEQYKNYLNSVKFATPNLSNKLFTNNSYIDKMNHINQRARGFETLVELKQKYKTTSLDTITSDEKDAVKWIIDKIIKVLDSNSNEGFSDEKNKNGIGKGNKNNTKLIDKIIALSKGSNTSHKNNRNNNQNNNQVKKLLLNLVQVELLNNKTHLAKSQEWLESNMPHTHKNVIILPRKWFSDLVKKNKKELDVSALNNEALTLLHELLHIHQRKHKHKYNELYKKWGFTQPSYIHNSDDFFRISRNNPDANDFKWVWNNNSLNYIIGAVFNMNSNMNSNSSSNNINVFDDDEFKEGTIENLNLTNVSYKIHQLESIGENIYKINENTTQNLDGSSKNIKNNKQFNDYFGITNNHYHPNEIASQYLEFVFYDIVNDSKSLNNKGYNIFKNNLKIIFDVI
jgi:hypothetical protein